MTSDCCVQAAIAYWDLLRDPDIARLATFGQIPASVPATAEELVHASLDTLVDGWHEQSPTPENRAS